MCDGHIQKYSAKLYFLKIPVLFGNRTSKDLGILVHRTSGHFKIFLPLVLITNISQTQAHSGWSFVLNFNLRLRNGDYQNPEIVLVLRPADELRNPEICLYLAEELYSI